MLKLDESLLLGKGNERLCYVHPEDASRVVKVAYRKEKSRNQNRIEYLYFQSLTRRHADFAQITRCFGWVQTDKGEGLVFERVQNGDGSAVASFESMLKEKRLERRESDRLMEELRLYLKRNGIVFADVSLSNVMCRKNSDASHTLVIVDGLGARRLGWKFWLYRHVKPYIAYKADIQWAKVMRNYKALVNTDS